MDIETKNKTNGNLEELLKTCSTIDELFDIFNTKDLRRVSNYQIVSICYKIGHYNAVFERKVGRGSEDGPNYQKALTRLEIIKNKFFQEAKRGNKENAI